MSIDVILRNFERDHLAAQGELLHKVCAAVQAGEPRAQITCTITPQYRNMRYWLEDDMRPVELAREACRQIGVEPFSLPVRGGTDGSRLSFMGLPTPNIFNGSMNFHGKKEWVPLEWMEKSVETLLHLADIWVEKTGARR